MLNSLKIFRLPALLLLSCVPMMIAQARQPDATGELVREEGWQLVQATCTECHNTQLIVQNSGSREVWKSRLVWMQQTQGLRQLEPVLENGILDYLAANYGQKASSRRPGLPVHLMPVNPYDN